MRPGGALLRMPTTHSAHTPCRVASDQTARDEVIGADDSAASPLTEAPRERHIGAGLEGRPEAYASTQKQKGWPAGSNNTRTFSCG